MEQGLKLAVASLQDYETAQSTLKLLASDYKSDKAYKHLAGVQVSSLPGVEGLGIMPCTAGVP